MAHYAYNPYQPDGNKMNAQQRSQYGFARTPSRARPEPTGRISNAVSTADWFGTLIITAIPVIGLICLLVWAFGRNTSPSKANYANAMLFFYLIGLVIAAVFVVLCLTMWPTIAVILQPLIIKITSMLG